MRFLKLSIIVCIGSLLVLSGLNGSHVQAEPGQQANPTAAATPTAPVVILHSGDVYNSISLIRVDQPEPSVLPMIAPSFCKNNPEQPGSKTLTAVCDVPLLPRLYLTDGLRASTQDDLETEWPLVSWAVYLDGQPIDLTTFATYDLDVTIGTKVLKTRNWLVELDNVPPGKHNYRSVFKATQTVTDPINGSLAAGEYTYSADVNVGSENFARPCPAMPVVTAPATAALTPTPEPSTSGGPAFAGMTTTFSSCGARIDQVSAGSPAARSHLNVGDIILAVDGISVITLPSMNPITSDATAGQTVTYTVAHSGKVTNISVTYSEIPTATPIPTAKPTSSGPVATRSR